MVSESNEKVYSCEYCDEEFEGKERLHEHMEDVHDGTPDEKSEESVVADTDSSGSTGSITVENNESPSAAEPAEAAGPSENEDEVGPDSTE